MDYVKRFVVKPGKSVRLKRLDPGDTVGIDGKEKAKDRLGLNLEELARLQYRLYAESRRALLIVLQGMDTAGKDGTIRNVMSGLNPQGCSVTAFKQPSTEELAHDFLWRIHRAVPPRGVIGIFNRSHYEDVLVARVHNLAPEPVWSERYEQINQFEKMLTLNGVSILKFFLHISKDEQRKRLQDRMDDPDTHWKFTAADLSERRLWDDYMEAYEDAVNLCSSDWAPWFVIPSNHKWFRNLAISTIVLNTLKSMDPAIPRPTLKPQNVRIR